MEYDATKICPGVEKKGENLTLMENQNSPLIRIFLPQKPQQA